MKGRQRKPPVRVAPPGTWLAFEFEGLLAREAAGERFEVLEHIRRWIENRELPVRALHFLIDNYAERTWHRDLDAEPGFGPAFLPPERSPTPQADIDFQERRACAYFLEFLWNDHCKQGDENRPILKGCERCARLFATSQGKPDTKYCSASCRVLASRKRVARRASEKEKHDE